MKNTSIDFYANVGDCLNSKSVFDSIKNDVATVLLIINNIKTIWICNWYL